MMPSSLKPTKKKPLLTLQSDKSTPKELIIIYRSNREPKNENLITISIQTIIGWGRSMMGCEYFFKNSVL